MKRTQVGSKIVYIVAIVVLAGMFSLIHLNKDAFAATTFNAQPASVTCRNYNRAVKMVAFHVTKVVARIESQVCYNEKSVWVKDSKNLACTVETQILFVASINNCVVNNNWSPQIQLRSDFTVHSIVGGSDVCYMQYNVSTDEGEVNGLKGACL